MKDIFLSQFPHSDNIGRRELRKDSKDIILILTSWYDSPVNV